MPKKSKRSTKSARKLAADLREKGISFTSTGVRTAAVSGRVTKAVNLATVLSVDVDWRKLPEDYWDGMSEVEWQGMVKAKAEANGWIVYHTLDSRGSDEGFHDLVMAKSGHTHKRLYFVELKDEDGKRSPAQERWHEIIRDLRMDIGFKIVKSLLWRPGMWLGVQGTLTEVFE